MLRNIVNHNFVFNRRYIGKIKGVILDWSGTTADKYVMAPAEAFCKVFEETGLPITMKESREPMGLKKDLHIKYILEMPEVKSRWFNKFNRYPDQNDINNLFEKFIPAQLECLEKYSSLIPGTAETIYALKNEGLKIGCTTGFTRQMVDVLEEKTILQGYKPDICVAGDEVLNGQRPKPFMLYRNMDLLNLETIESVLKVDDTVCGIEEGLNAGCWTVGLSRYSNYMDIDSLEHEKTMSKEDIEYRNNKSKDILRKSGAHYVIDDITGLPEVIEHINNRLALGESP